LVGRKQYISSSIGDKANYLRERIKDEKELNAYTKRKNSGKEIMLRQEKGICDSYKE